MAPPSLLWLMGAAVLVFMLHDGPGLRELRYETAMSRAEQTSSVRLPGVVLPGTTLPALRSCTDFHCLRAAHSLPRGPGQTFNFPHFFIIGTWDNRPLWKHELEPWAASMLTNFPAHAPTGFPKCATTSLAAYLHRHPQALGSSPKVSECLAAQPCGHVR